MTEPTRTRRRFRRYIRLYTPFVLLGLAALGWYGSWLVIRSEVIAGFDQWVATEATAGREWVCKDRNVTGFPARIELRCNTVEAFIMTPLGAARIQLKSLTVVGQVYTYGHYIAEAEGPLNILLASGEMLDVNWRSVQMSLNLSQGLVQRISSVSKGLTSRLVWGKTVPQQTFQAESLEVHVRPHPTMFLQDNSYEATIEGKDIVLPILDDWTGGREPMQIMARLTMSQVQAFFNQPTPANVDSWRLLGGRLMMSPLDITKGERRVVARGDMTLDPQRRPSGRIDLSATGIEALLQKLTGNNPKTNNLISSGLSFLSGLAPKDKSENASTSTLRTLPPLRFDQGKAFLGPIPMGSVPPVL